MYRIFQLASLSFYYVLERGFNCTSLAWPDTHPDSPLRGVDTAGVLQGAPCPLAHDIPQSITPLHHSCSHVCPYSQGGHARVGVFFFEKMQCPMEAN